MALCFPDLDTVDAFKVPLTPGERALTTALVEHLDEGFEVYVQPFLNGDRPDLVVVRKGVGVLVIEVKDWRLATYHTGGPTWRLRENDAAVKSPVEQVETYKDNLFSLHVEELATRNVFDRRAFGLVSCAVYLHGAETNAEAHRALGEHPHVVGIGREVLGRDALRQFVGQRKLGRRRDAFDDGLYEAFRRYLRPPVHHPDEGRTIVYTKAQAPSVESVAGHRRKVRGVAGAGKTRVLAGRAVSAHKRHGQEVLILTFNLALRNYIHDRISDVRQPFPWSAFHINSYHQFFKSQANNHNLEVADVVEAADTPDFFAQVADDTVRYATILIDEVQDYESVWIQTLADYFLEPDGELVVFGDEKQNVYHRALDEKKLPKVPTVPGDWRTLKESHRLGPGGLRLAQDFQRTFFADRYTPDDDVEQGDLFAQPGVVRYHHTGRISDDALFDLVAAEITALGVHPNEVAVLSPSTATVRAIEQRFRTRAHERTERTFETQEQYEELAAMHGCNPRDLPKPNTPFDLDLQKLRRVRKLNFWPNPGVVKLSTVLSFKGWEAPTLVFVLRHSDLRDDVAAIDEVVYTALTRAKTNAVVIEAAGDRYRAFFEPYTVASSPGEFGGLPPAFSTAP